MRRFFIISFLLLATFAEARPFRFHAWAPVSAPLGITGVHSKSSGGSTTDGTVYTSGSFTPTANQLIIAFFEATRASSTDPGVVTVTDSASLTWTQVSDFYYATSGTTRGRIAVYAAKAGASPPSMTVTGTYAGTVTGCVIGVFEVIGADVTTVAGAFVQTVTTVADSTGTSATVTLSAFSAARNRVFFIVGHSANEDTTPRSGWSEIGDNGIFSPSQSSEAQWRSDAFETTASAIWTTSTKYGGIAFEVKSQ